MAGIASLTDRGAVLKAIEEYKRIGREAFLDRYGFGRAKWWYLLHERRQYDSKAIVGAAIGYQTGQPLTAADFSGGEASVVRKLRDLGFTVTRLAISEDSSSLPEEVSETFPEGMRTTLTVNRVERSAAARLACIDIHGTSCAACGTDFEDVYGPEFSGLIHVHHLNPLAGSTELRQIDPGSDLRPVCPNCHAAIHYGGANRSIEEIQACLRPSGDLAQRNPVEDFLSGLYGEPPFEDVLRRAEPHRESHGSECGLYPAGPSVMRLAATIAQTCRAQRVLDLGAGIGYSALWLASAVEGASVEAIDKFEEHVEIGKEVVDAAGLSDRISFICGEVADIIHELDGPYDLIHDDAWFAWEPPYLERAIDLLRPGGVMTMPNWFLLEDAITGRPRRDWSEFAGTDWSEGIVAYARRLAEHPRLQVTWSISPPIALALKRQSA